MKIPPYIIANADDLGLHKTINNAILYGYQHGYINSTSLLTNTVYFDETVTLIHQNPIINNIGVHIDFAEGKPISNFNQPYYLNDRGNWDIGKTNKTLTYLSGATRIAFLNEIYAQIDKALSAKIEITHLDSHYHLHTLPCFYPLFLQAAKHYHLKLRLAQTYNEGSLVKFAYRKYINHLISINHIKYADRFETVARYLENRNSSDNAKIVEIMLHPDFNAAGVLTDHYDAATMATWINFLNKSKG